MATPKPARRVAAGRKQVCAVLDSDEVACAGYLLEFNPAWDDVNAPGQESTEVVSGVNGVGEIAEASVHICVLKKGGDVVCWGRNDSGQLGRGITETYSMTPGPVALPALAKAIGVGVSHSCAVLVDDTVWCWGRNDGGNGDGTPTSVRVRGQVGALPDGGVDAYVTTPRKIEGLPAAAVHSVVGGYDHSCALVQGGAVYCWGSNGHGQLGRGKDPDASAPDDDPHPTASKVLF
jgi:alpha-tubulin suppressor-like RCC1 family protein